MYLEPVERSAGDPIRTKIDDNSSGQNIPKVVYIDLSESSKPNMLFFECCICSPIHSVSLSRRQSAKQTNYRKYK